MKTTQAKTGSSALKIVLIIVIIVLFASVSLAAAFLQFYKPSGGDHVPFLTDPVDTEPQTPEDPNNVTLPNGDADDTTAPTQTKPNEAKPYTQQEGIYNFLLLGHDRVALNTDVVMIVNFNTNTGSVSIMQLPRDTYIEVEGIRYHRINAIYGQLYMKNKNNSAVKDPYLTSLLEMEAVIEQSLCINIQNSIILDLDGFVGIVDALGGVNMYVPQNMDYDDPEQGLSIHLRQGQQTLTGKQAEGLVRFRDGYLNADISRLDAQKLFMSALINQVKTNLNMTTISKVIDQVLQYVTTDMSSIDCIYYAKEALGIDMNNITMMTMPSSPLWTSSGAAYVVINRSAALDIVNQYFNVYNTAITDSIFDRNLIFSDESDSKVHPVYLAAPESASYVSEHTAQEMVDNSLTLY